MKSMRLEMPDRLADELDRLVKAGWFHSEQEAIRLAIVEFLSQRRLDLVERFEREDIDWALRQKRTEQQ
ncbi:MAG TPA: ribbon-helix-helix domain-containing protein [Terriglobia bacterium]|nr:ribbon-helix-helix domain-containing protein [Terriglobia bacterium]